MNYTKGKWEIKETLQNDRDKIFYHTSVTCGGKRVAHSSGIGEEEAEANGKLIAAAPDLLEALKDLVKAYDVRMGKNAIKLRIELAKDAIIKAE